MARLLGPDDSDRFCFRLSGSRVNTAAGQAAVVYAGAVGDTRADILFDSNGTQGAVVPNSVLTVDMFGLLPLFWFPDGVSSVWVQVAGGPRTKVSADFDARIITLDAVFAEVGARVTAVEGGVAGLGTRVDGVDTDIGGLDARVTAVEGGVAGALPLTGGTLTGPLTVMPGSSGAQNAFVVGDGSVSREIEMMSSYAGGQDTSANLLKFDSTSRINFYLYQQALNQSYGEPLRFHMRKRDAKAAITWKGPTAWTAWTADPGNPNNLLGGDPIGPDRNWAWLIAHYEANDHSGVHGHLSVELPAADQTLQTRLAFPIWDPNGIFGSNQTNITVNLSHLTVRASNSLTLTPNYLRVSGPTTYPKYLEFSLSHEPAVAPNLVRFRVGVDDTGESTGNAGSNFTVRRYADDGTFLATSLYIQRASGNASFGNSVDESARVAAVWGTASHHGFLAKPTVSITNAAAFASILQTSADRIGDHRVIGDTNARLAIFMDKIEWGGGSGNRDVNVYRNGPDVLRTDDSLIVGPNLAVNTTLDTTSVIRANTDGTTAALRLVATADGTASTGMVIIHPSTVNKRAIDVRLSADSTSRFRVDTDPATGNARITLGDGAFADVNLYRNGPDVLRTDDSLIVGGTSLAVNGVLDATSVVRAYTDGTRPGLRVTASADGTAATGVIVVNPFTIAKRAVDVRLTSDTVSRLRIEFDAGTGSGMITFGDGTTSEVGLWRSAPATLKTAAKFVATGGIGVGNSVAATTSVGALARKIQVFDAAGASLGFVPVYTTIT